MKKSYVKSLENKNNVILKWPINTQRKPVTILDFPSSFFLSVYASEMGSYYIYIVLYSSFSHSPMLSNISLT